MLAIEQHHTRRAKALLTGGCGLSKNETHRSVRQIEKPG